MKSVLDRHVGLLNCFGFWYFGNLNLSFDFAQACSELVESDGELVEPFCISSFEF